MHSLQAIGGKVRPDYMSAIAMDRKCLPGYMLNDEQLILMVTPMRKWRCNAGDAAAATAKEPLRKPKRKKRRAVAASTLITPPERTEASLCCCLTSIRTPIKFCAATVSVH